MLGQTTLERLVDAGSYVNGDWVPSTTSSTFRGSVQPISGRERENLPEGYRTTGRFKMYTKTTLRTSSGGDAGHNADLVVHKGVTYEVATVEDWSDHKAPTSHHQYLLLARAQDGNP